MTLGPAAPASTDDAGSPVVSADDLLATIDDPRLVLLDARWALGRHDGRDRFVTGHVPGAVFVDLPTELAGPGHASAGRHPLPDAPHLQTAVESWGLDFDSRVVVYDDDNMMSATRCWWVLRWAGHPDVRVLDGGLRAWREAGGAIVTGDDVRPGGGTFVVRTGAMATLDATGAAAVARDGVLLDARAPERYRGETEPIDRVAGHVPGARNAPASDNLTPTGRLRPTPELAAAYAAAGVRAGTDVGVGAYCGSGISATLDVLALELLGVRAALYAPSWSGWTSDPTNPVERTA
jgi:thiosulfate/3-mercaptopyruvate sulfurtransferase